ncbi:hypothetical protein BT67DRAFT_445717 [Trichocladium antarcticum]|uniref:Uncharacterized protein n=1 Tax=Trichocladium antarcticum TaxID=1450529 RepID=A0AAN6ZAC2_9PEZI|nr:hypothetical protein BT67DRAFT_445717 [Trichocladium antarcticum]
MLLRARLRPGLAGGILSAARPSPASYARQQRVGIFGCVTVNLDPSRGSLVELKVSGETGAPGRPRNPRLNRPPGRPRKQPSAVSKSGRHSVRAAKRVIPSTNPRIL